MPEEPEQAERDVHGPDPGRVADGWPAELHGLWLAANGVQDVTDLAHLVYRALLTQPGAVVAGGVRWDARGLIYSRTLTAAMTAPDTRRPPAGERRPVGEEIRRHGDAAADGPVVIEHDGSALDASLWPGEPGQAFRAAGTVLECVFPLGTDRAALWLGLDSRPEDVPAVRTRLEQVAEILMASNHRLLVHRAHERRQVEDAFLAEASLQMDSSLDVEETLRRVARLAVPAMAEGCVVHLFGADGSLAPVASAHVAAPAQDWLAEVSLHDAWLGKALRGASERAEGALLRGADLSGGPFGPGSEGHGAAVRVVSVSPLRARGRTLGTLTFLHHNAEGVENLRMLGDLAGRAALAIDTSTLYEQRRRHVEILQRHLLPRELPEVPGLVLSSAYEVADDSLEVGGDFYDAVVTADGRLALIIGDVCGRGAEAAALTGLARHTLRTLLEDGTAPGQALARLNRALIAERSSRFVTALVALLIPVSDGWEVELANAGHPRPVVRSADGTVVEELKAGGVLLGVMPRAEYAPFRLTLGRGESLVLFTDGLLEARGADGSFFEERLAGAVRRIGQGPSAADRLVSLASEFRAAGDDDTAVLIAEVRE
ncbi:GAF domain-containing SpoIIE family protein phosphatase [Streptomyces sp. NPDC007084]|uniref:PP2C family protein-serine/threonine phosphatase n=1 Tax=Streptomyces sp. NPDC007084 TaxID=3154313 RepID=UPI0034521E60